ncbi:hypothetical protein J6590_029398 [Homalodisca vitripennis]|nr:hypothetical protein J6590_029398 [Homalodisca vitripennis]
MRINPREKRITYLRALKNYRDQGRPIIYLDESFILSSYVANQTWSDSSNEGLHEPISKGERLIIIHASGDYHDNVNWGIFMKWIKKKVFQIRNQIQYW